jgi:hypothetical protein
MNRGGPRMWIRSGMVLLTVVSLYILSSGVSADAQAPSVQFVLPALNPAFGPLAAENRSLLLSRIVTAFDRDYAAHVTRTADRDLADGITIYHVQREFQACIDMWRATGSGVYLEEATDLALRAIEAARANPRILTLYGDPRGEWPCFYLDTVVEQTGGHSQLCDYQGSAGLLLVARALHELDVPAWKEVADFVEHEIVHKWLYRRPSVRREHLLGPDSYRYLLITLNSGRDTREHFACICMDLHALGYRSHPYLEWAKFLVELYLTPRHDPGQLAPYEDRMPERIPRDWGLPLAVDEDDIPWLSILDFNPNNPAGVLDTSHANRTAWLAARANAEGLIDGSIVDNLANTFRYRIWAPEKGPLYFNNYVDGSDYPLGLLTAGRGGNIWFGWHRLSAYHPDLQDLYLSVAYDLTNGGPNLPHGAQNKTMREAPLCLKAWAARLLTAGQIRSFP